MKNMTTMMIKENIVDILLFIETSIDYGYKSLCRNLRDMFIISFDNLTYFLMDLYLMRPFKYHLRYNIKSNFILFSIYDMLDY